MKIRLLGSLIILVFSLLCPELGAEDGSMQEVDLHNIDVPIICYHSVIPDNKSTYNFHPDQLEAHLKYFKENNYQAITALQFMKLQKMPEFFPKKPIMLTFDDGYKSHYQYVLPLLQKYGMQATFFVCPELIAEKSDRSLTWGELREMARAGMDIQSHTMSHPDLAELAVKGDPESLSKLEYELKSSKEIIEEKLKRKVNLLAYPYGYFTKEVEDAAVKAGYEGIFTVNWGTNSPDENPLRIKRMALVSKMSLEMIEPHITSKPLRVEIISPIEASVITEKPVIKFKPLDPGINRVDVMVRSMHKSLRPDDDGVYTYEPRIKKPGYYMVIIRGYDTQGYLNMGSWGFYYQ